MPTGKMVIIFIFIYRPYDALYLFYCNKDYTYYYMIIINKIHCIDNIIVATRSLFIYRPISHYSISKIFVKLNFVTHL